MTTNEMDGKLRTYYDEAGITIYNGNCLDVMPQLEPVDLVLADPPYGTTQCKWDTVIPLDRMWEVLKSITHDKTPIVLCAGQPFTSVLITSNLKQFRYLWVWDKRSVTGFANAKKQPLRHVEDVTVFCEKGAPYNPQGLTLVNKKRKNSNSVGGETLKGAKESNGRGALRTAGLERVQAFTNYPRQLLNIPREIKPAHPTQKPVALMEYMIKTYTNPGDTVLDFTMGSGTTLVAARNLGRKAIGIELDEKYCAVAVDRLKQGALLCG